MVKLGADYIQEYLLPTFYLPFCYPKICELKYKSIILPGVLYEYELGCLIIREEHTLRIFKDALLRKIFGPKREETVGS